MFKKPFTVKSNTNLRNSDSRKLLKRLPEKTANNLPKKAAVAHIKLTAFNNIQFNVYTFDKVPLLFDTSPDSAVVPTVYATWIDPGFCPMLVVHEQVLSYLENGADLMLPGVIRSEAIPLPSFDKGAPIAISMMGRDGQLRGPMAIGCALLSSDAMLRCGMQGKGAQILHVFRDHLWEMGPRTQPPLVDYGAIVRAATEETEEKLAQTELETSNNEMDGAREGVPVDESDNTSSRVGEDGNGIEEKEPEEPMEDLLLRCFLAGVRYRLGKSATFPFDVGQFYSQCLLKCVPENRRLDVKRTKYKKFANFLTEINKCADGPVVKISSKGKGVDVISEVKWDHPLLTRFKATDERIKDEESTGLGSKGPKITEYYAVTEAVVPLLAKHTRVSRGDLLQAPDVRELVTAYVKNENLNAGKSVRLDPLLSGVSGVKDEVTDWNTLIQKVLVKMTKTFLMVMPDGRQLVKKLKMPKIVFKVETRSGNKKVTLVSNVASFGLDAKEVAHKVQVGVAASATLGEAPCCEGPQITVQGNQVSFIGELLGQTYGIDKKYIEGLDLAPKKKK